MHPLTAKDLYEVLVRVAEEAKVVTVAIHAAHAVVDVAKSAFVLSSIRKSSVFAA
jgi:hypothetical protein